MFRLCNFFSASRVLVQLLAVLNVLTLFTCVIVPMVSVQIQYMYCTWVYHASGFQVSQKVTVPKLGCLGTHSSWVRKGMENCRCCPFLDPWVKKKNAYPRCSHVAVRPCHALNQWEMRGIHACSYEKRKQGVKGGNLGIQKFYWIEAVNSKLFREECKCLESWNCSNVFFKYFDEV
jgi:hypothetical protein